MPSKQNWILYMRVLILFAAWMPDSSDNSKLWSKYYFDILSNEFGSCDKIIAFNHGSHPHFEEEFRSLPSVLCVDRVSKEMHINSDAAPYQLCLMHARPHLENYDLVLFLHTKGASKDFIHLEGFRWYFGNKLFNQSSLTEAYQKSPNGCHMVYCHPPTFGVDVRQFNSFIRASHQDVRPFMLNATYTVYACPSSLLARAIDCLPANFFTQNIGAKYNRFFFELIFPSLLISLGGVINPLGDSNFNPLLNRYVSYNYDLSHNTALTIQLWNGYLLDHTYEQAAIPMMFGPLEEVSKVQINYSP
jgi:hypothetical protein